MCRGNSFFQGIVIFFLGVVGLHLKMKKNGSKDRNDKTADRNVATPESLCSGLKESKSLRRICFICAICVQKIPSHSADSA